MTESQRDRTDAYDNSSHHDSHSLNQYESLGGGGGGHNVFTPHSSGGHQHHMHSGVTGMGGGMRGDSVVGGSSGHHSVQGSRGSSIQVRVGDGKEEDTLYALCTIELCT